MTQRRRLASVACAALVLAVALPRAASAQEGFGKNKIQYKNFHWQVYHAPHFDVYYYDAEATLLERVVSFAESSYDELSRRFDYQIESSTPLIFYRTHAEFEQNNIQLGFIDEAVGAFATDVRFRMVLPVDLPDIELHQLIQHELTHIFQYHILFNGHISRSFTQQPPTWLIEGMASYYAKDESTSDKMFLRDAVVNDLVPPIATAQGGGYFAYRFGHAVFDYMEEKWGQQGVLDFLYEYRSTLGGNIGRALHRAFRVEAEDFDADFRRWMRDKYLPELVKTGEPSYFGRRFLGDEGRNQQFFGPTVAPSGDLVAAISNPAGDLDVLLFDTHTRRAIRNLTKGWTTRYQHITGQYLGDRRRSGSDLSFSPDGNWIAAFARHEGGRALLLIDVLHGGVGRMIDLETVQQPFGPHFSPDGQKVAFAGNNGGQFDIYLLDLQSGEVSNLTNDARFDGGPAFTPDGGSIVYSSEVGAYEKLFRIDLAHPDQRVELTKGNWSDLDPFVTKDGKTIFFTSDRNGFENIYSLELATGEIRQHTNAVTGCYMPQVLERADGTHFLVYNGYWKGTFDLYRGDLDQQGTVVETLGPLTSAPPTPQPELTRYEPDIQVTINDDNKEKYGGFKLFVEDGDISVGYTSDNLLVSSTTLTMSDYLGNHRLFFLLDSVSSYTNFDVVYMDLSRRLQWGGDVFDNRQYFLNQAINEEGQTEIDRRNAFRRTGVRGFMVYPFNIYHRAEASVAYLRREYDFQSFVFDEQQGGGSIPVVLPRTDSYPELGLSFVGDTAIDQSWGTISGRRWRIGGSYGADVGSSSGESVRSDGKTGGGITSSVSLDFRQYISITRRIQIAFRSFAGASWGLAPDIFAFGGLDTVRGFDYQSFVGDRAFYSNLELRFPMVDALILPFGAFQGIRGRIFLDLGGSWFDYAGQGFVFWDADHRLQDARSSYGWGFTVGLGGLDLNWDFSKIWDFKNTVPGSFSTSFWIGSRF